MLPHVEHQQRNDPEREIGLVVIYLEDQQLVAKGVPAEHRPTGALHSGRGRVELATELVERPERVVDGGGELAGRLVTTAGGQVLPPQAVVDVAAQVEREVLLAQQNRCEILLGTCLLELGERIVGALDVGSVVFAVVKFVDLTRDMRLQRTVVPVQLGLRVFSHGIPSFVCF